MKWLPILLLTGLSLIHLVGLSNIPPGLSNDEANIGYEAWSIATTGKDQWGNFFPIVFQGFGNWSLPVYIYLTVPFVWILGPTVPAVRAVSALSFLVLVNPDCHGSASGNGVFFDSHIFFPGAT